MTNVTPLPTKDKQIWVCDCGCTTFEHYSNGDVLCASCENECLSGAGSGFALPDRPSQAVDQFVRIAGAGEDFVRRRLSGRAMDKDCHMIVMAFESGEVAVWEGNDCDAAWLKSRLNIALSVIESRRKP